jgi:hypothetical protein
MSTISWSAYRDPAARRAAAAGATRPPLPLPDQDEALEQAAHLHDLGLNYRAVSLVMAEYHGQWAPSSTWNARVNRARRR